MERCPDAELYTQRNQNKTVNSRLKRNTVRSSVHDAGEKQFRGLAPACLGHNLNRMLKRSVQDFDKQHDKKSVEIGAT